MSAGLLWLGVVVILAAPNADQILAPSAETDALLRLINSWPVSLAAPVVLAGAFLLGMVATPLTLLLMRRIGKVLLKVLRKMEMAPIIHLRDDEYRFPRHQLVYSRAARLARAVNPISDTAYALLFEATSNILGRAHVPGGAVQIFPIEHVARSIRYTAAQLSIAAPTLYQDYDRLKAEAELRLVILPPLLYLAAIAPLNGKPWVVLAAVTAGLVLLTQSISQQRAANDILANAAYLDQVALPSVQSVAETLKSLSETPTSDGEWMAALITAMNKRGLFDDATAAVRELFEYGFEDIEAATWYLKDHDRHHFNSLVRQMKEGGDSRFQGLLQSIDAFS